MLRQPPVIFSTLAWLISMIFGISQPATAQAGPVSGLITRSLCCNWVKMRRIVQTFSSGVASQQPCSPSVEPFCCLTSS